MVSSTIFLDIEQGKMGQCYELASIINAIPWNKDGLITAIAQDIQSKDVLMLAWINRDALLETPEYKTGLLLVSLAAALMAERRKFRTSSKTH